MLCHAMLGCNHDHMTVYSLVYVHCHCKCLTLLQHVQLSSHGVYRDLVFEGVTGAPLPTPQEAQVS